MRLYKNFPKNKIILESVQEIPEDEAWLFLPKNKKILACLKKSLKEDATVDKSCHRL